jgi:CRISPR-associated protein Cmr3
MTVKIILEPLEPFFFGGEHTFGKLGDGENGSYIAQSERFPTQTALLGMLRKEMLLQAGLLTRKIRGEWVDKPRRDEAIALVGIGKPDLATGKVPDLGKIERIGPVHLVKEKTPWLPKVHTYDLELHISENTPPLLKEYNPKYHDLFDWLFPLPQGDPVKLENVFETVESVGNQKKGDDDAFFKKRAYRLTEGFAFAFDATLDFDLEPSIVSLGADGSRFKMRVEPDPEPLRVSTAPDTIVLLSDTLFERPLDELCAFAITEERRVKSLTGKKSVREEIRTQKPERYRFHKSHTAYFYRQGTVVYRPNEAFDRAIQSDLQTIGYNITTTKESL